MFLDMMVAIAVIVLCIFSIRDSNRMSKIEKRMKEMFGEYIEKG